MRARPFAQVSTKGEDNGMRSERVIEYAIGFENLYGSLVLRMLARKR